MDSSAEFDRQLKETVRRISRGFVLVIDDNREVHRVIRSLLSQTGIENIKMATDVSSAISFMDSARLSFVICDFHLKDRTAVDIFAELRARPQYFSIPFLIITNDVTRDELLLAKSNGIRHCILKPFTLDLLQEKIVEAFEDQEALRSEKEAQEELPFEDGSVNEDTL